MNDYVSSQAASLQPHPTSTNDSGHGYLIRPSRQETSSAGVNGIGRLLAALSLGLSLSTPTRRRYDIPFESYSVLAVSCRRINPSPGKVVLASGVNHRGDGLSSPKKPLVGASTHSLIFLLQRLSHPQGFSTRLGPFLPSSMNKVVFSDWFSRGCKVLHNTLEISTLAESWNAAEAVYHPAIHPCNLGLPHAPPLPFAYGVCYTNLSSITSLLSPVSTYFRL